MPSRKSRPSAPFDPRHADKYELYQRAVQAPDYDVELIGRIGRVHSGRRPLRLREDFCGTALVSCTWASSAPAREAWGIDIDPEPLAWGRAHNVDALPPAAAARVHLVRGDVLRAKVPRCDVVLAPNFSFFCFRDRATMSAYFRAARAALLPRGVFIADVFGGPDAMIETVERRRVAGGYTYEWEQSSFDPVHARLHAHIGFRLADGTRRRRLFSYDWRLWSIPELREIADEAGFRECHVYWETIGRDGKGTGSFRRVTRSEACDSYVASIVAVN